MINNIKLRRKNMTDKQFEEQFKNINEQFKCINKQFEGINKRFEKIDERFNDVDRELKEVKKEMKDQFKVIDNQFKVVEDQFRGVNINIQNSNDKLELDILNAKNELLKEMDKRTNINSREHSNIMDIIEYRYEELNEEMLNRKEEIRTLHELSKMNDIKHKEYDKLLNISNA